MMELFCEKRLFKETIADLCFIYLCTFIQKYGENCLFLQPQC